MATLTDNHDLTRDLDSVADGESSAMALLTLVFLLLLLVAVVFFGRAFYVLPA
ncbi:MAG: hypothetical protein HY329_10115 [Chloroflexi bacterium]|nr:hypothetical protein [Chloroflexota bacterium]